MRESRTGKICMTYAIVVNFQGGIGMKRKKLIHFTFVKPGWELEDLSSIVLHAIQESVGKLYFLSLYVVFRKRSLDLQDSQPRNKVSHSIAFITLRKYLPKILFVFEFPLSFMKFSLCTESGLKICLFPQK